MQQPPAKIVRNSLALRPHSFLANCESISGEKLWHSSTTPSSAMGTGDSSHPGEVSLPLTVGLQDSCQSQFGA